MCIIFFRMTGTYVTVNGKECLNLATFNFLGLLNKKNIHVSNNVISNSINSNNDRHYYLYTYEVHFDAFMTVMNLLCVYDRKWQKQLYANMESVHVALEDFMEQWVRIYHIIIPVIIIFLVN